MKVLTTAIGSVSNPLPRECQGKIINWVFFKIPWFDTTSNQFQNLRCLEKFALSLIATDKGYLNVYMRLIGKHTLPEELRNENLCPESSPLFFVSGKKFQGKKELIEFVKDQLIPRYQDQMVSSTGLRRKKLVEVTEKNDKAFLLELFKYHPDQKKTLNITNVYFGPSEDNGGVTNCFHIRKFVEEETEYFETFDPNLCEFQFAEPGNHVLKSQPSLIMGDQEVSKTLENKRDEGKKSPSQPPNEVGGPKEEGEQNELESDEIFQQLLSGFEKIGPSHLYTRVSDDFTPIDIHDQPVEKVQEKQSLIEESVIIEDKVSASLIEENLNFKFGESSKKFEQPVPVQVESHHEVPSKNLKIVFPIIGNPNEQKAPQFNRPASRRFVTEDISYKKCINNIFSNILYKKLLDECCQRNNIFIDKVTSLLFTILRKYPLQIKQLREILEQELAHHLQGKVVVITQLHNMLMIANRIPELESSILESVLDKIMKIDSEGYSESLKEKADDLIQLFLLYLTNRLTPVQALQVESSEPQVKASDFDICFDKGISHLESSVFGDSTSNQNEPNELFQHDQRARTGYSLLGIVRQNSTFFQNFEEKLSATLHLVTHSSNEKLVELLLTFFSRKVIKVEKPMYIQFVFFYLCTFEQELSWIKEAFLETLILNIMDPRLQRQVKLNSLYYLFSFLACANFSTPLITFTALQYLLKACRLKYKSYIRKNRYLTEFLNQSGYKIDAQISGKDYSQIIEDSANQLNSMLRKRRTETEDIKSMGDDIFIYCLQSFLYILCDHFYRMNKQQKRQIMDDFDNFMSDKELFLRFSNAESDVFEDLYNKLVITVNFKESKARQKIKRILEEEEQQSLLNSKDGFPQFKIKSGLAKGIDYFPFEPVEANFFHKFIEQHVDCGSTPSSFFSEHHENEIVNDQDKQKKWERGSNLSVMDTSTGTCNQFKGDISPFVQQKNKRRTMTPPSRKMLKL